MKGEAVSSFVKLTLSAAGVAAGADGWVFPLLDNVFSIPVFGVPVTIVGAAAVGAGMSLFFGDPVESRKSLFGQVLASTAFGVGVGVLFADAMNLEWAQKNLGMFVMMTAALMRWFLPSVIDRGKQFIKEFKFSFSRKTDGDPK